MTNQISIEHLKAETVIQGSFLSEYQQGMDFFYHELVLLNVNLYIIEKIITFPFHLFIVPENGVFFRMVFENFFYVSLLMVTRLTADHGEGNFTLVRFKNRVMKYVKNEYRDAQKARLREVRFDKITAEIIERAKALRNERIAHLDEHVALNKAHETLVFFGDLQKMRDQLNKLFDSLGFDISFMMLPVDYHPDVQHPKGTDPRSDIEIILDKLAQSSPVINMPEENAQAWANWKKQYSDEDIAIINKFRGKFNLPSV